jgi:hypothetical protein
MLSIQLVMFAWSGRTGGLLEFLAAMRLGTTLAAVKLMGWRPAWSRRQQPD